MSRTVVGYLDANGDAVNRLNVDVPLQLKAAKAIGRVTGHPDSGFPPQPEEYRRRSILVESQGHRGARGLWPESVVPAFARAMALGVHSLELDVHLTKDGVLVVYHDEVLQSGTVPDEFVGKRISELTAAQISTIDAAVVNPQYPEQQPVRWAAIPTLREVLDLADRLDWAGTWLIEAKTNPAEVSEREATEKQKGPWPEGRVRELIGAIMDEFDERDQTYRILDFDWRGVALASELAAERTGNLPEGLVALVEERDREDLLRWFDDPGADVDNIPAAAKAAGATVLSAWDTMVTPELMAQARAVGIAVSVWTVNDADRMRELIAMGVSGIITDHPDVLRTVLLELGLNVPRSVTGASTAADREAASAGLRRARETAAAVGNDVLRERALDLLATVERLATEPSASQAAPDNVGKDSGDRQAELASALEELAATARELGLADPTQLYTGGTVTDPLARQLLDLHALDKLIAEIETRRVSDLSAWIAGVGESRELVVAADSDAELARAVAAAVLEDRSSEGLEARYVVSQGGAVRGRRGGFDGEPVSMRVLMSPSGDEFLVGVFTRVNDRWIERWLDRDGQPVPESEAKTSVERIADEAREHVNLPEFGHPLIGSGTPTPSVPEPPEPDRDGGFVPESAFDPDAPRELGTEPRAGEDYPITRTGAGEPDAVARFAERLRELGVDAVLVGDAAVSKYLPQSREASIAGFLVDRLDTEVIDELSENYQLRVDRGDDGAVVAAHIRVGDIDIDVRVTRDGFDDAVFERGVENGCATTEDVIVMSLRARADSGSQEYHDAVLMLARAFDAEADLDYEYIDAKAQEFGFDHAWDEIWDIAATGVNDARTDESREVAAGLFIDTASDGRADDDGLDTSDDSFDTDDPAELDPDEMAEPEGFSDSRLRQLHSEFAQGRFEERWASQGGDVDVDEVRADTRKAVTAWRQFDAYASGEQRTALLTAEGTGETAGIPWEFRRDANWLDWFEDDPSGVVDKLRSYDDPLADITYLLGLDPHFPIPDYADPTMLLVPGTVPVGRAHIGIGNISADRIIVVVGDAGPARDIAGDDSLLDLARNLYSTVSAEDPDSSVAVVVASGYGLLSADGSALNGLLASTAEQSRAERRTPPELHLVGVQSGAAATAVATARDDVPAEVMTEVRIAPQADLWHNIDSLSAGTQFGRIAVTSSNPTSPLTEADSSLTDGAVPIHPDDVVSVILGRHPDFAEPATPDTSGQPAEPSDVDPLTVAEITLGDQEADQAGGDSSDGTRDTDTDTGSATQLGLPDGFYPSPEAFDDAIKKAADLVAREEAEKRKAEIVENDAEEPPAQPGDGRPPAMRRRVPGDLDEQRELVEELLTGLALSGKQWADARDRLLGALASAGGSDSVSQARVWAEQTDGVTRIRVDGLGDSRYWEQLYSRVDVGPDEAQVISDARAALDVWVADPDMRAAVSAIVEKALADPFGPLVEDPVTVTEAIDPAMTVSVSRDGDGTVYINLDLQQGVHYALTLDGETLSYRATIGGGEGSEADLVVRAHVDRLLELVGAPRDELWRLVR